MKNSTLAKNGGAPVRSTPLPYSRQVIDEDDIRMVAEALRGDIITRGPFVERFENKIAEYSEMPFCVSFSSATAALHAAMYAFKVSEGAQVMTTPNTFIATANAVRYCQGMPVFADVDASTMNLSAQTCRESFKHSSAKNILGIVAVDFAGNPCDYDSLRKLATEKKVWLIDDASHSIGAKYKGRPIGSQADLSIFSFHPVKSMTTGEGGAIVCKEKALADQLRQFKGHGIKRTNIPGYYEQEFLGFNYNITDIQCALGLAQLKKLSSFVSRRRELAFYYLQKLKNYSLLTLPAETEGAESAWHLFPLRIDFSKLSVTREEFLSLLHAENIMANVHYIPVYLQPYYQNLGYARGLCPQAERAYSAEISIPLFASMTTQDADDVCTALDKLLSQVANAS